MKLAAEKNLNKYAFPIFSIKGRRIDQSMLNPSYNGISFKLDGAEFGPRNWMIMDILGTYMIHRIYNFRSERVEFRHKIPTSNNSEVKNVSRIGTSWKLLSFVTDKMRADGDLIIPNKYTFDGGIPKKIDGINDRMKRIQTFVISDSYLKKQIPFLQKYSSNQIYELFWRTSRCTFEMIYPIRFFSNGKYYNFNFNNLDRPSHLFTFSAKNKRTSKDDHVLEREYTICFNTLLGYFYIQNCVSAYIDLLPEKFYLMSDYAQLFYRILIVTYFNGKKIPIGLEEIRRRLCLSTKDSYMVRKIVKRILDELEANSFIQEPRETRSNGEYAYHYVKSNWKEINASEDSSGSHLAEPDDPIGDSVDSFGNPTEIKDSHLDYVTEKRIN